MKILEPVKAVKLQTRYKDKLTVVRYDPDPGPHPEVQPKQMIVKGLDLQFTKADEE